MQRVSTSPSDRLLQVVVDLLVSEGFEGVSVRKVASCGGRVRSGRCSTTSGPRTPCCRPPWTWRPGSSRTGSPARSPPSASPETALRVVAEELLGLGADARPASVLWVVRLARAAVDPETAAQHAREWQEVESSPAVADGRRPPTPGGGLGKRSSRIAARPDRRPGHLGPGRAGPDACRPSASSARPRPRPDRGTSRLDGPAGPGHELPRGRRGSPRTPFDLRRSAARGSGGAGARSLRTST